MAFTIGPYVVERGAIIPYEDSDSTEQIISKDGDGGVVVTEIQYDEHFIKTVIRVTRRQADDIATYLKNGVRYAAIPFTIVDGFGTTRLVRFWDKEVKRKYVASNIVELELTFREEVV